MRRKGKKTKKQKLGLDSRMKIAFVGKGGSGKTTLSSLFSRYLSMQHVPVIAIDADINQHLGTALGLTEVAAANVPAMGLEIERIKEYLRGTNPRITAHTPMIKTTPPGTGSRLLRVKENNPIFDYFAREVDGIRLLATGPFSEADLGLHCYHSKVGAVELLLNHLLDSKGEYVVVDMTAGADSFASGLFTRFDLTFVVVEPTRKALSVYQQYKTYAQDYDVKLQVIGNKVESEDDLAFLREQSVDDLLAWIEHSSFVRQQEKGQYLPLRQLEASNLQTLEIMKMAVDACKKDWERFYQQAVEFHQKNALGWANASAGADLTEQIDPEYALAPQVERLESISV
jgi:CO dehydrogenase maturation factor